MAADLIARRDFDLTADITVTGVDLVAATEVFLFVCSAKDPGRSNALAVWTDASEITVATTSTASITVDKAVIATLPLGTDHTWVLGADDTYISSGTFKVVYPT